MNADQLQEKLAAQGVKIIEPAKPKEAPGLKWEVISTDPKISKASFEGGYLVYMRDFHNSTSSLTFVPHDYNRS